MPLRASRVVRAVMVGGLVLGATALSTGSAAAGPTPANDPVPARCGETVEAAPGQTVRVTPALGLPFLVRVEAGMDPIRRSVAAALCRVDVNVVEPVAQDAGKATPPLRPVTEAVEGAVSTAEAAVGPEPETDTVATPKASVPSAAPRSTPEQAAAAAPAFGSAFGSLPSSFLRGAAGPAPVAQYDPRMLLGSAFGGLRAEAPAYLGYEPASAVTTASHVQALPIDGLTEGGVGLPAVLAVLGLSGASAFLVRRLVLGRTRRPVPSRTTPREQEDADSEVTTARSERPELVSA